MNTKNQSPDTHPPRSNQSQESDGSFTERAQQKSAELADKTRERTAAAAEQARRHAEAGAIEARRSAEDAATRSKGEVAGRVGNMARALHNAEAAMRDTNEPELSQVAGAAATHVERVGRYLDDRDVDGLVQDTQDFGRRNPAILLGGAFTIGLAIGRFLKSSERRLDAE